MLAQRTYSRLAGNKYDKGVIFLYSLLTTGKRTVSFFNALEEGLDQSMSCRGALFHQALYAESTAPDSR